jgi:hypothetical protein
MKITTTEQFQALVNDVARRLNREVEILDPTWARIGDDEFELTAGTLWHSRRYVVPDARADWLAEGILLTEADRRGPGIRKS